MSKIICQKNQFLIPKEIHYLCGHSLGPLSKEALRLTIEALKEWENAGAKAWESASWIELPFIVGTKISALLGAKSDEVIVTDSTSVNLYKVILAALSLNPKRKIILTEKGNFPTDLYIAEGIANFYPDISLKRVEADLIRENLSENIAILLLSHVNYRDSTVHDITEITRLAQQQGIIVVWDLSHSIGMIPLNLDKDNIDFAVGCTYKYLNGGPGAPSFIYINKKHHRHMKSPIQGWMGHSTPFRFDERFVSKNNAGAFLAGTPSILSMKALQGALSLFDELDMQALYRRNQEFSDYLIDFVKEHIPALKCLSPLRPECRGGHIAFEHKAAGEVSRTLWQKGILCDTRNPHLMRLSLSPLFLEKEEVEIIALSLQENTSCNH